MIRITATKHDKARLEIIEYDILAWLSWPVHLLAEGFRKLSEAVELYAKGSCTVASTECKRLSIGVIAGWSAMRYRSAGGFRRSAASTGAV